MTQRDPSELRLTLQNDLQEIRRLSEAVVGFLDSHAVTPQVVYAVRLVVEEIVVNVIKHAFDDGQTNEIVVSLAVDAAYVVIRVEDDGRPFDPTAVEEPDLRQIVERRRVGGIGIHMARLVSHSMKYDRKDDRNLLEVRVKCKKG